MARPSKTSRKTPQPAGEPELLVEANKLEQQLNDRIASGEELKERPLSSVDEVRDAKQAFYSWDEFNQTLLTRSFSTAKVASVYSGSGGIVVLGGGPDSLPTQIEDFRGDVERKLRRLRSLRDQLQLYDINDSVMSAPSAVPLGGSEVFVVHGHHDALKEQVARNVARLTGRDPIILHEQPDGGRTIIEKFEALAHEAGFAVVLLTADDRGAVAGSEETNARARQNVVFELGFFIGRLGRSRVAVLYEADVELPSDMSGVLYTPVDEAGAWRMNLAREMKAAGVDVDLNNLV